MRMQTILFFLCGALIISCSEKKQDKPEIEKGPVSETDTFYLGDKLVQVEKATKAEFDKLDSIVFDTSEVQNLLADSSSVKRKGDTLFFSISNNRKVTLVNNYADDDDTYVSYSYLGFMKDIDQFLVFGVYYEWYNYLLIDKQTGDTTITCGDPVVSPNKKYFICGNADLEARFTFNGFELYENTHKPKLVNSRELGKWGPEMIKWLDNETMLARCSISDTAAKNLIRTDYFKLKIK